MIPLAPTCLGDAGGAAALVGADFWDELDAALVFVVDLFATRLLLGVWD